MSLSETDLYPPIKAFLEAQGYEVKGEVRGCDVVARRADEPPVIVEMKTRFGTALLLQGVARLSLTDTVYIAFPPTAAWRKKRRDALALCRRLGLGALVVTPAGAAPAVVEPALDPGPYQPRKNMRRAKLLLREFERRRGDPSPGGLTRRPIMTAYRQSALRIAAALDAETTGRPAELKARLGVENAAAILQRDVYGWFERVERGVYALSEAGRAAARAEAGRVLENGRVLEDGRVLENGRVLEDGRGSAIGQASNRRAAGAP